MYRVLTLDNESNPSLADPDGSQVTDRRKQRTVSIPAYFASPVRQ